MTRTDRAELILGIARRILEEQALGRSVDPDRLAWAKAVALNASDVLQPPTKSSQLPGVDIRRSPPVARPRVFGASMKIDESTFESALRKPWVTRIECRPDLASPTCPCALALPECNCGLATKPYEEPEQTRRSMQMLVRVMLAAIGALILGAVFAFAVWGPR